MVFRLGFQKRTATTLQNGFTIACPHCNEILRSTQQLPRGAKVKCSKCDGVFFVEQIEPPPTGNRRRRMLIFASGAACVTGLIIIAVLVFKFRSSSLSVSVVDNKPDLPSKTVSAESGTAREVADKHPLLSNDKKRGAETPTGIVETVVTQDGRRVALNENGNWHYLQRSQPTDSAIETVRAYVSAKAWRNRLQFVLTPEEVEPLMQTKYGDAPFKSPLFEILTTDEPRVDVGGWCDVYVEFEKGERPSIYELKKTKDGFRIDWEASVGYNPMSGSEFNSIKSVAGVRFRCLATLDSHYYGFKNSQHEFWSIKLLANDKFIGWGYVLKKSNSGERLYNVLKDGKWHRIFVTINYDPSRDDILISNVLNVDSWRLEK